MTVYDGHHLGIPVEEYTTPSPLTVEERQTGAEVLEIMVKHNIRHVPVVRKDGSGDERAIGILSDRDLRIAQNFADLNETTAGTIMTHDPFTVVCDARLDEVVFKMSDRKIGSAIVNDQAGNLLGIFTSTDALNALVEILRGIVDKDVVSDDE